MNPPEVTVIDYGVGNLLSVRRGFEHFGACVRLTADPSEIFAAPRVVLPGVGAFEDGMKGLKRLGLDEVIRELAQRGTPLLGICLGMQMLLDESEEFGVHQGLGLVPGRVVAVPHRGMDGASQKIPHIGWAALQPAGGMDWQGTIMATVRAGESAYFVHSFMAAPTDSSHRIADCYYGGVPISATIRNGSVYGCQFHPEKSGAVGLRILRQFLST